MHIFPNKEGDVIAFVYERKTAHSDNADLFHTPIVNKIPDKAISFCAQARIPVR